MDATGRAEVAQFDILTRLKTDTSDYVHMMN